MSSKLCPFWLPHFPFLLNLMWLQNKFRTPIATISTFCYISYPWWHCDNTIIQLRGLFTRCDKFSKYCTLLSHFVIIPNGIEGFYIPISLRWSSHNCKYLYTKFKVDHLPSKYMDLWYVESIRSSSSSQYFCYIWHWTVPLPTRVCEPPVGVYLSISTKGTPKYFA